jgi:hypothetical protein
MQNGDVSYRIDMTGSWHDADVKGAVLGAIHTATTPGADYVVRKILYRKVFSAVERGVDQALAQAAGRAPDRVVYGEVG